MLPPPLPQNELPPPLPRRSGFSRLWLIVACIGGIALLGAMSWAAAVLQQKVLADRLAAKLMTHADNGHYQKGLDLAEQEMPNITPNAKVYYAMEHLYYGLNNLDKTKFYAQKTLETDSGNEMAARMLISICRDFDDNEFAYQAGKSWIARNPNGTDIYKDLAMAADDAGHDDDAYKYAAEAHRRKPDHPRIASVYFYYALQNRPVADAMPLIDNWLKSHKADEFFWAQIGKGLSEAKEWKEAIPRLQRAWDAGSDDAGVVTEMLECYRMLKDRAGAETFFERLKSRTPPTAAAWRTMGALYYDLDDYKNALETFRQAQRADPDNAITMANILYTLIALGRPADAINEGNRWLSTKPTKATSTLHHALGNAHFTLSQWTEAEKNYRTSLRIAPNSAASARELVSTLSQQGRKEDAVRFGKTWQEDHAEIDDSSFKEALAKAGKEEKE